MLKKTIKYAVSIVIFLILFFMLQRLVMPKYAGELTEGGFTEEYYEETTEHDVIMIGDCEVYEAYDPIYLWNKFGITCYIRGNAQQLTWQSYYMLEDTLKYETPKIVIYNVQALTHDKPQKEEYNRMTLDGMKWSGTKYRAIKASMCKGEKMADYIFPIFRYHSRILNLSDEDIKYFADRKKVTHNGYYMRSDVLGYSQSDGIDGSWLLDRLKAEEEGEKPEEKDTQIIDPWADIEGADDALVESGVEEQIDLARVHTKGEDFGDYPMLYLDKMRELCEENGITLIFVKAPSLAPQWYDTDNDQVVEYAKKYGIEYINFYELIDETKIDYETDTYDGGFHLNLSGADKLSEYLGNLLATKYGVPDRRNDEKTAAAYKEKEKFYEEMIREQQEEMKNGR